MVRAGFGSKLNPKVKGGVDLASNLLLTKVKIQLKKIFIIEEKDVFSSVFCIFKLIFRI